MIIALAGQVALSNGLVGDVHGLLGDLWGIGGPPMFILLDTRSPRRAARRGRGAPAVDGLVRPCRSREPVLIQVGMVLHLKEPAGKQGVRAALMRIVGNGRYGLLVAMTSHLRPVRRRRQHLGS
jgi:hypothetical protein